MNRRGVSIAAVLALGTTGGALLGGCGGSTKTVSVSEAASPIPTTSSAGTASTPTRTTTTSTTPAPATTGAGQGTGGQSASTTRTAPAPAFTETGTQSGAAAAGAQTAAAAAVVTAHGYTPDVSDYHPTQALRVLVGTRTGSADGYAQRAFFFLDSRYLGTDSSQPSASIHVVSQSDTEVALAYSLYRSHDPLCCPSGGQAVVHFQLNDGTLVPLQPLPPASSTTGLARQ
jgi:LppP/LprE lipoprotein